MLNDELMLAKPLKSSRQLELSDDWFLMEKLDGVRCLIHPYSAGEPAALYDWSDSPAGTISTGLWSRNGKVINAPKSWVEKILKQYGKECHDGELWLGRKLFQPLVSIVRKHKPIEAEWDKVKFVPFHSSVMFPGHGGAMDTKSLLQGVCKEHKLVYGTMKRVGDKWDCVLAADKRRCTTEEALDFVRGYATSVCTTLGGEGLMLRDLTSVYPAGRTNSLLKVKPTLDMEGMCVGTYAGEGKLTGKLGGLVLALSAGKQLRLGVGFNYKEREKPAAFYISKSITFTYRELSDDGVPKEARYLRVRTDAEI